MSVNRIIIHEDPFISKDETHTPPYGDTISWPAKWLPFESGKAVLFQRKFTVASPIVVRFHISADERYELELDRVPVGRGPEAGIPHHWFFDTFEVSLNAGEHVFAARAWAAGSELTPWAQMSVRPGFLMAFEPPFAELSTGCPGWELRTLTGFSFDSDSSDYRRTGVTNHFDLTQYPHHWDEKHADWAEATSGESAVPGLFAWHYDRLPCLFPSPLPQQMNEEIPLDIEAVELLPHESREWIIDMKNYYCFYPQVTLSGNGQVMVGATETLRDENNEKMDRNHCISGKILEWSYDVYNASTKPHTVSPVYFRCGRFLIIRMKAGDDCLKLHSLKLFETRYPLEITGHIDLGENSVNSLIPMLRRSLEMCSHETYMDCPFWERQMYIGDTRIESLITNVISPDRKLQRLAIELFSLSRNWTGHPASCYPSRKRQTIPGFSLILTAILHDHLMWTGDIDFLRKQLPAVRACFESWEYSDNGLLRSPTGWNFVTAARGWKHSVPPCGLPGQQSAVLNMLYLLMSKHALELEKFIGDPSWAHIMEERRNQLAGKLKSYFYNSEKKLFADDFEQQCFSEPMQCMAMLSGCFPNDMLSGLFEKKNDLLPSNFYFSYYYFEACREAERVDRFFERLTSWNKIQEWGLSTTPESDSPYGRSDCHAWSASPLFHFYATIAGIRPDEPEFRHATIKPNLEPLKHVNGSMPHPSGGSFTFELSKDKWNIALPKNVGATLILPEKTVELTPGESVELNL